MSVTIPGFEAAFGAFGAGRRVAHAAARRLRTSLRAWATTRRHRRELALLCSWDERMLRDIGLTRGDVQCAAAMPFWRDPGPMLEHRAGPRGGQCRPLATGRARPDAPSIVPALPGCAGDLAPPPSADVVR